MKYKIVASVSCYFVPHRRCAGDYQRVTIASTMLIQCNNLHTRAHLGDEVRVRGASRRGVRRSRARGRAKRGGLCPEDGELASIVLIGPVARHRPVDVSSLSG